MKSFSTASLLLFLVAFVGGCGSSSPLAPTQSAIALEKSFTAAVKVAQSRPLDERVAAAPYVHEGSKILDELADKTQGYTKPLTVSDFGDVAMRLAPDIAALLDKPKHAPPATQPAVEAPFPPPLPSTAFPLPE